MKFIYVSLLFFFLSLSHVYGQSIEGARSKLKEVKETLKSNQLKIQGGITFSSLYNYIGSNEDHPGLDTRFSAFFNLEYKGLKIPFQYNYSNGRTVNTIFGPNIRTPSFSNLGFSPNFNKTTFHFGYRQLEFSKYTLQGSSFKGVGMEHEGKNTLVKFMMGNLAYTQTNEFSFFSSLEPPYTRRAGGGMVHHRFKKLNLGAIVFKARDKFHRADSLNIITPRENANLELNLGYDFSDQIKVEFSRTLSAFTENNFEDRDSILSHSSFYNLLGFFERKPSSRYNYATTGKIEFQKDNYLLSLDYEQIDPGYRSLGTFLFDNNFRAFTFTGSSELTSNLSATTTFGRRFVIENQTGLPNNASFLLQTNINYKFSDKTQSTLGYSNLNNTQRAFNRRTNSTIIDSIFLFQSNQRLSSNTIFQLGDSLRTNLSVFANYQKGFGIEADSVENNNEVNSINGGINFSTRFKEHNFSAALMYLNTKSNFLSNTSLMLNLSNDFSINEKQKLVTTLGFNWLSANGAFQSFQTRFNTQYTYSLSKTTELSLTTNLEFGNTDNRFAATYGFISLDIRKKFNFELDLKKNNKSDSK